MCRIAGHFHDYSLIFIFVRVMHCVFQGRYIYHIQIDLYTTAGKEMIGKKPGQKFREVYLRERSSDEVLSGMNRPGIRCNSIW